MFVAAILAELSRPGVGPPGIFALALFLGDDHWIDFRSRVYVIESTKMF
jgi:hypothetical protein